MNDAESGLCFIDSNVWLYAFVQAQALDKTAKARALIQSRNVVINSQVINEVCLNLIKKAHFDEVTIPA